MSLSHSARSREAITFSLLSRSSALARSAPAPLRIEPRDQDRRAGTPMRDRPAPHGLIYRVGGNPILLRDLLRRERGHEVGTYHFIERDNIRIICPPFLFLAD